MGVTSPNWCCRGCAARSRTRRAQGSAGPQRCCRSHRRRRRGRLAGSRRIRGRRSGVGEHSGFCQLRSAWQPWGVLDVRGHARERPADSSLRRILDSPGVRLAPLGPVTGASERRGFHGLRASGHGRPILCLHRWVRSVPLVPRRPRSRRPRESRSPRSPGAPADASARECGPGTELGGASLGSEAESDRKGGAPPAHDGYL